MRYICRSRNVGLDIYPFNDAKKLGKIEAYLDWHHTNTRKCAWYIFNEVMVKQLGLKSIGDPE